MKLITFGSSFLSPTELTQVVALLLMMAGFMVMIGFRKAGFAMIGGVLVMAFLPVLDPFFDSIFSLLPAWAFWLLVGFFVLAIFRWVLELLIGRDAANHAIGDLAASAIKNIIAFPFRVLRRLFF